MDVLGKVEASLRTLKIFLLLRDHLVTYEPRNLEPRWVSSWRLPRSVWIMCGLHSCCRRYLAVDLDAIFLPLTWMQSSYRWPVASMGVVFPLKRRSTRIWLRGCWASSAYYPWTAMRWGRDLRDNFVGMNERDVTWVESHHHSWLASDVCWKYSEEERNYASNN